MKQLSIITICYNAQNLDSTCQSVLNQTWRNFEWIVIDGGSDQKIQTIWEKYKKYIDIFVSEKDSGVYNAMNKGIKLAKGRYLLFLNGGDSFADNNVLEDVFNASFDHADILYGDTKNIRGKRERIIHYPDRLTHEFWINSTICHQASFIKASLFKKYGLYDESYKNAADYEKWLNFYFHTASFKHIPRVISNFLLGGISNDKKHRYEATCERERAQLSYFKLNEIRKLMDKGLEYSFWDRIFSSKMNKKRSHIIITILNLHIKIRIRQAIRS